MLSYQIGYQFIAASHKQSTAYDRAFSEGFGVGQRELASALVICLIFD